MVIAEVQLATSEIVENLHLSPGNKVVVLQRVRLAEKTPIALETTYLDHDLCLGILKDHDFSRQSLYKTLREEYNCPLTWAKQWIQARLPTPSEQKLLAVDGQTPVLSNTRITYTRRDRPVEYVTSIYLSDRFKLTIILR